MRDNTKLYNALSAQVMGISVDSFYALKAFKEAENLNFVLLSDFNKEVSKQYDVLYDEFHGMSGVAKRAAFVINKERNIVFQQVLDDAGKLPDFASINQALEKEG